MSCTVTKPKGIMLNKYLDLPFMPDGVDISIDKIICPCRESNTDHHGHNVEY